MKQRGKAEKFLKELFIIEQEIFPGKSPKCDDCSDSGMPVREFFSI